jgi:hypothetical protein
MVPMVGRDCHRWTQRERPAVRVRRHFQNLAVLVGCVFILVAMAYTAQADTCRQRNFVDDLNLIQVGTSTVRVTSTNGDTYDHIESVGLTGDFRIALCSTGSLFAVIVHFGSCSGHQPLGCTFNPVMYLEFPSARDFHKARELSPFAIAPDSPTGQSILRKCNAVADQQRNASEDRIVDPEPFFVTLGVETRRDTSALGGATGGGGWGSGVAHGVVPPEGFRPLDEYSKTRAVQFRVNVACAPFPQQIKAPPEPVSVNLSAEPKGETCPKQTDVTAWIYYEEPAVAQFRFKVDGELSGLHTRQAIPLQHGGPAPPPNGGVRRQARYLVKETRTYHLDPGQHHFRIEVRGGAKSEVITRRTECPPFKVTSAWLKYDVEDKLTCPKEVDERASFQATRPGKAPFQIKTQGGLVVHSGTAMFERKGKAYVASVKRDLVLNAFDQDMMALIKNQPDANSGWTRLKIDCLEVLSGTLELREFAATRCEGEAALSIRTNMPGEVPYQLDCTGGRSWSGTAQSQKTGPDTSLGVDTKRFKVSNNEHVNCALKTRPPLPVKVLALKGNKYACHRPSPVSGTSDLAPETRPDPREPSTPDRVVTDPPPASSDPPRPGKVADPAQLIACAGGVVRNGQCHCPRTHKAVLAGRNAWRCVRTAVIDRLRASDNGKAGSSAADSHPGPKRTRQDVQADRRRLQSIKKAQQAQRKRRLGEGAAK